MSMVANHKSKGFTLIEMLVVMLIIALMAGFSISRIGNNADRLAKQEAKRFHQVVKEVTEFSLYTGSVIGIEITENIIHTAVLDFKTNQWDIARASKIHTGFHAHRVDGDVSLTLQFSDNGSNNVGVTTNDNENRNKDVDVFTPQLVFSPLGDTPAFNVIFRGDKKAFTVSLESGGDITMGLTNERR